MSNSAFQPTVLTIPSAAGGTGQGELNLVTNPVAASNLDGWVGAGRGTSGGPLNPSIDTYFTVLNTATGGTESSTTGAYDVISLPSGLQNKKLKVEFYYTSPAVDTFKVSVYKGTTRVPLTTDVSGSTSLPKSTTGKFVAYFDTDSSGTWTLSITRTAGTGGTPLQFTNVVVGPGIQPQGAVVGEWTSYTAPLVNGGSATFTYQNRQYRRVGDSIEVDYEFSVTANGSGASFVTIPLPTGLTVNFTAVPNETMLGPISKLSGGVLSYLNARTVTAITTGICISIPAGALTGAGLTSGDGYKVRSTVPIAEWAGSGTVQLAQNDVEYAWNSGNVTTANGSDTSSFGYGPSGTPILAYASTAVSNNYSTHFAVKFQTPIQAGDAVVLELNNTASGSTWIPAITTLGFTVLGTATYGASLNLTSPTTVDISFGNAGYVSTSTYGAAGGAWSGLVSSGYRWRVRKSSAGAAVGFGIVQPGVSSGLVSASGLPGNTTGNVVASGYVGEVSSSFSKVAAGVSTGSGNIGTALSVPAGVYLIVATCTAAGGSGMSFSAVAASASGIGLTNLSSPGQKYSVSGTSSVNYGTYVGLVNSAGTSVQFTYSLTGSSVDMTVSGYYIRIA